MKGFTVRDVLHGYGAVAIGSGATIKISECKFISNQNPSGPSSVGTVSVLIGGGGVVVESSYFRGNRSYSAACCAVPDGFVHFRNNVCVNNEAYGDFCGVTGLGQSPSTITGNLFVGNKAPGGSALLLNGGGGVVAFNTFVADTATGGGGAIWLLTPTGGMSVMNNLMVNCVGSGIVGGAVANDKNNLFNNTPYDYAGSVTPGPNSFSADPLFVGDSFYLSPSSPCLPQNNAFGELVGARGMAGPVVDSLTVAGEAAPTHVKDHTPTIAWAYDFSSGPPQAVAEIQVGTDANWNNGAEKWATQSLGPGTSIVYAGDSLHDGQDYWLRVRASDSTNWSAWVETQFHMNTPPPAPTQLYPTGGQEVSTHWPEFAVVLGADAEGDSQEVYFAFFDQNGMMYDNAWLLGRAAGDTVKWTSTYGMIENEFYFWYTVASDLYESSDPEATWDSLYVNIVNDAPPAPSPLAPAGDSTVFNTLPVYHWSRSADPDVYDSVRYTWILSVDSLFQFKSERGGLADSTMTDTLPLQTGKRYWWKVKAEDNHGLGALSAAQTFRIYVPADVNLSGQLTASDLIEMVNYVFKGGTLATPACVADFNVDGKVSAADLIALINHVFKGFGPPAPACHL
jgi:hypothetical protein